MIDPDDLELDPSDLERLKAHGVEGPCTPPIFNSSSSNDFTASKGNNSKDKDAVSLGSSFKKPMLEENRYYERNIFCYYNPKQVLC